MCHVQTRALARLAQARADEEFPLLSISNS